MRPKTKTVITLGFTAVIGLTVDLDPARRCSHPRQLQHTKAIVEQDNTKMRLVTQMRTTARERTLSLHKMIVLTDPFAPDEEWLHFNAPGGPFIEARLQLKELELSPVAQDLLARQATLSDQVVPPADADRRPRPRGRHGFRKADAAAIGDPGAGRHLRGDLRSAELPTNELGEHAQARETGLPTRPDLDAPARRRRDFAGHRGRGLRHRAYHGCRARIVPGEGARPDHLAFHRRRGHHHRCDRTHRTDECHGRRTDRLAAGGGPRACPARGLPAGAGERPRGRARPDPASPRSGRTDQSERDQVLVRADGREFAIEHTASPVYDRWLNRLTGIVLVFRDVTEMRALSRQLGYQTAHDNLTGLPNRREFEARLEQLITPQAHAGQEDWLCYVDQFKVINDTCGHFAGDKLLKQIADGISLNVRDTDVVARMGGDEFAILLRHCPAVEAERIVERIRDAIQQLRFAWEQKTFSCSASIGMVPLNMERGSPYDLLSAADTACYVAKDEGRNRVHIYHHGDHVQARHEGEMQWMHRINRALEEDRFVLYYQRIEPLQSRPSGMRCELLLRMVDED